MDRFHEKIVSSSRPVILYEVVPPNSGSDEANVEAYAQCTVDVLQSSRVTVDAINIPEIRGVSEFSGKVDARKFAELLRRSSSVPLDFILNHVTVHEPLPEQRKWLEEVIHNTKVSTLILVGGESGEIAYPGPSVTELTRFILENYNSSLLCGGIAIPSRQNEPSRLIQKGESGIEFFTTQILYEAVLINDLLKEYDRLCKEKGILPKRIFLSFAPISTKNDLNFLRWLGVVVPDEAVKVLYEADIGVGWRSLKMTQSILQEIIRFRKDNKIAVPIGLNIEHISLHNFELSKELIELLGTTYLE